MWIVLFGQLCPKNCPRFTTFSIFLSFSERQWTSSSQKCPLAMPMPSPRQFWNCTWHQWHSPSPARGTSSPSSWIWTWTWTETWTFGGTWGLAPGSPGAGGPGTAGCSGPCRGCPATACPRPHFSHLPSSGPSSSSPLLSSPGSFSSPTYRCVRMARSSQNGWIFEELSAAHCFGCHGLESHCLLPFSTTRGNPWPTALEKRPRYATLNKTNAWKQNLYAIQLCQEKTHKIPRRWSICSWSWKYSRKHNWNPIHNEHSTATIKLLGRSQAHFPD